MRILFLTHSFNSLAQRLFVELSEAGHEISIEFDVNDRITEEAVALWRPEVVIAPFLKRAIPESVWRHHRCLVVHPGIEGDRGPSALDWAIMEGEPRWGVTVLQATGEMDAGPVWASVGFEMRYASKSSLYRNEVTTAAVQAVHEALEGIAHGRAPHLPGPRSRGRARPLMRQADRAIIWDRDDTATVLRKVRAADGNPGVHDCMLGVDCRLFDAHAESALDGYSAAQPGRVIAQRAGALCRVTRDGAVWITHLARDVPNAFKLPAAMVLGEAIGRVPEIPARAGADATFRDIEYEEANDVGYLRFHFYNGAMGTAHCERLREAYAAACARSTRVIVLLGGEDFWSNGIHLNLIEAHAHPADESWRNINAMNDLVRDIVCTQRQLTIAAMRGNAGAGGAFLALAADRVYARDGIVLNPHYRAMGNLFGSEYWTYLLPRRVAAEHVDTIVGGRLPMGVAQAERLGLVDARLCGEREGFMIDVRRRAEALAAAPDFADRVARRNARRVEDEAAKPLAAYRDDELDRMRLNFYGFDPSYHVARHDFVTKVPRSRTPPHLAVHRRIEARKRAEERRDAARIA